MVQWELIYEHDFRTGHAPNYSGWGNIQLVDEGLKLSPDGEYCGCYFFPVEHPQQFMLEATAKMVSATDTLNIQLLTRDGPEVNDESGLTLYYGINQASVRHMVNKVDYLLESFQLDFVVELDRWYDLRFAFYDGKVEAYIDGEKCYESKGTLPESPVKYTQPHLAVFNGTAIFQVVRVYEVAPPAKPPSYSDICNYIAQAFTLTVGFKEIIVPSLKRMVKEIRG